MDVAQCNLQTSINHELHLPSHTHLFVKRLHQQLSSRPDVTFPRKDEEFLLWFVEACAYDCTQAFELLVKYNQYRERNRKLFRNLEPSESGVKSALMDGLPGVLAKKDHKNRHVLVLFAANWDQPSYGLASIYRAMWLTLEKLLDEEEVRKQGVVLIVDWCQFSFKQSTGVQPHMLKLIIEGLQDCFPVRFQEVHFLNQPWYVDAMFKIAKNFMSPENRNKVHLHGNNMATLCCYVSEDILPAEFGGLGPPYHMHSWATHMLKSVECTGQTYNRSHCPTKLSCIKRRSETFPMDPYTTEVDPQKRVSTGANIDHLLFLGD